MDRISSTDRSTLMARIRKKNTKPELAVRRLAHRLGYRFRLHQGDLPGTPDLVFRSRRKVVFVHGCFWHQHRGCGLARMPKTRLNYWKPKFARNKAHDHAVRARLRRKGWSSIVVWECQANNVALITNMLSRFLGSARRADKSIGRRVPMTGFGRTGLKK